MYGRELCDECKRNAEKQGRATARNMLGFLGGPTRPEWKVVHGSGSYDWVGTSADVTRDMLLDCCDVDCQRSAIYGVAAALYAQEVELLRRRGEVLCVECTRHAREQAFAWVNREMRGGPRPNWGLTSADVSPDMIRDCCRADLQRQEIHDLAKGEMEREWFLYDDDD